MASISAILSSVIGVSSVAGEASQLHPSRQSRWPPHHRGAPAPDSSPVAPARRSPKIPPSPRTLTALASVVVHTPLMQNRAMHEVAHAPCHDPHGLQAYWTQSVDPHSYD